MAYGLSMDKKMDMGWNFHLRRLFLLWMFDNKIFRFFHFHGFVVSGLLIYLFTFIIILLLLIFIIYFFYSLDHFEYFL